MSTIHRILCTGLGLLPNIEMPQKKCAYLDAFVIVEKKVLQNMI